MIFSENKRKIRAIESEVKDLKDRVYALEQNTKYYTDKQLNMFKHGLGSAFIDVRHNETVALADVVRKIAEHLKMSVNRTEPTFSQIKVDFEETK
jgi:hypothetical protein